MSRSDNPLRLIILAVKQDTDFIADLSAYAHSNGCLLSKNKKYIHDEKLNWVLQLTGRLSDYCEVLVIVFFLSCLSGKQ
jgi:hypothetical protein